MIIQKIVRYYNEISNRSFIQMATKLTLKYPMNKFIKILIKTIKNIKYSVFNNNNN